MGRKSWFKPIFSRRFDPWPRRIATVAAIVALWPVVMTIVYAVVPPPASNLMITRLVNGDGLTYDWVSLNQISPYLPLAVVSSEDQRFCSHNGVDWIEFSDVLDEATDGDGEGPIRAPAPSPCRPPRTCSCGTAAIPSAKCWSCRSPIGWTSSGPSAA